MQVDKKHRNQRIGGQMHCRDPVPTACVSDVKACEKGIKQSETLIVVVWITVLLIGQLLLLSRHLRASLFGSLLCITLVHLPESK